MIVGVTALLGCSGIESLPVADMCKPHQTHAKGRNDQKAQEDRNDTVGAKLNTITGKLGIDEPCDQSCYQNEADAVDRDHLHAVCSRDWLPEHKV